VPQSRKALNAYSYEQDDVARSEKGGQLHDSSIGQQFDAYEQNVTSVQARPPAYPGSVKRSKKGKEAGSHIGTSPALQRRHAEIEKERERSQSLELA